MRISYAPDLSKFSTETHQNHSMTYDEAEVDVRMTIRVIESLTVGAVADPLHHAAEQIGPSRARPAVRW